MDAKNHCPRLVLFALSVVILISQEAVLVRWNVVRSIQEKWPSTQDCGMKYEIS